jgi:tRNA-(ms[2]io[6]A)-hydroxylase
MEPKRRLPVLKADSSGEDEQEKRPPWQWVGFGTVAIFVAWLPLSYLAELARRRATSAWLGAASTPEEAARALAALGDGDRAKLGLTIFLLHGGGLALAALAGGYLVGRWGGAATEREAALAGVAAALIASVLGWSGISWVPLVTIALAALFAWLGGRRGVRARARI